MTLSQFIERNRKRIDTRIREESENTPSYFHVTSPLTDDDERRMWILNSERLYLWAQREGVDFSED